MHPHLHSNGQNTSPLMIILNGLLTEKRIVFLGHGLPSSDVVNYVLAACCIGSGAGLVLKGLLERAYPYTNLSNVDNLLQK